jgi:hypothetical protein
MPIDLSGFVSPEQNFGGLYKVSQNLRQETAQNEAEQRRLQAGKAASSKFLVDYLDQEQFLTGTPQDPYTVKKVSDLLKEGSALIEQGVDNNQLLMALSPKVGRLSQETQVLKQLDAQKKQAIDALKTNPAIDIVKFGNAFDEIYFETDEAGNQRLKDISKLDPSKKYADEVLNTKPVYTSVGFDTFVAKSGALKDRLSTTVKDSAGNLAKKDMKIVAPEFMVPEFETINGKQVFTRKFAPKHELATDGDRPLIAKFMNKEGREVDAQIRLLDQNTFANLPKEPMAYVMQEARQYAAENGIPLSDKKVGLFARALAYDALKNSAKQKTDAEEVIVQNEAPAAKVSVTVNNKGDKDDVTTIDLWSPLKSVVDKNMDSKKATLGENIPNQQYEIIAKIIGNRNPEYKDGIKPSAFILQTSTDGNAMVAYEKETKNPLATFTQADFDLAANQALGIKSKTKAVKNRGQQSGGAAPEQGNKTKKRVYKGLDANGKPIFVEE